MDSASEIGRRGQVIARQLWPSLRLAEEASLDDRNGRDGWLHNGNLAVQVKTDARIAETGNIYVELYEKTKGQEQQQWRHSPNDSQATIFVTKGFAVWITTDVLAKSLVNASIKQINPTSIGVLIPLSMVEEKVIKPHGLWGQRMLM